MEYEVLVLKLSSGEEIISHVRDIEGGALELRNPQVYLIQQGGFIPFMALSKDRTMVMTQRPMMIAPPSEKAEIAYLEVIGEKKIVTPPKDIILVK
jgi:hypothetical protein